MSLDSLSNSPKSRAVDAAAPFGGDDDQRRRGLEALFRAEAPPLLRTLSRRTGSQDEAMDVVQEAFLQLVRTDPAADIRNPAAYLQRIVQNLLKKRARRAAHQSLPLHDPLDLHVIPDDAARPDEVLIKRQILERYEAAVLRLPEKTRRIFLLHRKEGLTYVQIADRVGLTVSGVEKHMMKAIASLDRWLGAS